MMLFLTLWLFGEYSENTLSQDDIQPGHLLNPDYRFMAHGVHTYEHLRSLLTALYASNNPVLEQALQAYLEKLEGCLTPSGGPIGDEFILGRLADASQTGYEYCSIHELLDSYSHLLQKTGEMRWAERIEWLLFNAAQGARHPHESAIAYLKTDNSFSMSGLFQLNDHVDEKNPQTRYKYSPAHRDVAVCCVPNAGRIHPYYVKAMWMRSEQGLTAMLYGASNLQTDVDGVAVRITEETNYPFDFELSFSIEVAQPVEFELAFRKPAWVDAFHLDGEYDWHEVNGLIIIKKSWQGSERIHLRFEAGVKVNPFGGEAYLSYGPLLFALPLEGQVRPGKEYPLAGFQDLYYDLTGSNAADLLLPARDGNAPLYPFGVERGVFDEPHPWDSLALTGGLFDAITRQMKPVRLVSMGGTLLRRVTFGRTLSNEI